MPVLLQGTPNKPLVEFGLERYKISPIEPLHDLKSHRCNIIGETKTLVEGSVKEKIDCIFSDVVRKETLRESDYRKGAVLILTVSQKFQPKSTFTSVFETAVEISEILYSNPEKHTAKGILRLHNIT